MQKCTLFYRHQGDLFIYKDGHKDGITRGPRLQSQST
jgi:hypothetical protein